MTGIIIVAGSRGCGVAPRFLDDHLAALRSKYPDTDWRGVYHGDCPNSPDHDGRDWARLRGLKVRPFPANWSKYGKGAGMLRNEEMAMTAARFRGALFAAWDGKSPGTANMIAHACARGLDVTVRRVTKGRP